MQNQTGLLVAVWVAGISAPGAFVCLALQEVPIEVSILAPGIEIHVRAIPSRSIYPLPRREELPGKKAPQSPKQSKEMLIAFK